MTLPPVPENAADDLLAAEARLDVSEREIEILRLVATGASNKQIAQQLAISPNTVRVHLRNIFNKINVASRTEAAMYAVRNGLVKVADAASIAALEEPVPEGSAALETPSAALEAPNAGLEVPNPAPETVATAPPEPSTLNSAPAAMAAPAAPLPPPQASVPPPVTTTGWPWWRWLGLGLLVLFMLSMFSLYQNNFANQPLVVATAPPTLTPLPRWEARATMPNARSGFGIVTYETQVYVVGGENATGPLTQTARYDPATNSWAALAPLPVAVKHIAAAVVGGKIYVPGGELPSGAITTTLQVYDPRTDTWTTRAPLPRPLSAYTLVAFEGRLLLFGGWDGAGYTNAVWEYQPTLNVWAEKSPMPTARGLAGATLAGGKIYVLGGTDGKQALTTHEIYTPDEDDSGLSPWRVGPPLPEGRVGPGVVSAADFVYVLGGSNEQTPIAVSRKYLPTQAIWEALEPAPQRLGAEVGSVLVGTTIYVLGGQQPPAFSAEVWLYHAIYTTSFPVVGGE